MKTVTQRRLGVVERKHPKLVKKQVYQNAPKNPLEKRRRKRTGKMRKGSEKKQNAPAASAVAMTATLLKTRSEGKGLKDGIKTRKL